MATASLHRMEGVGRYRSEEEWQQTCHTVVSHLQDAMQINFLALDFDLTVLDVHTRGRWTGSVEELTERIRPFFRTLIPMAMDRGMCVAIVTFSPQVSTIKQVLGCAFPDIANRIPVRGEDGMWEYEGSGARAGKQTHIASAVEELTDRYAVSITRSSTLLVDDDLNNVQSALSSAVKAVWCNPDDVDRMVDELQSMKP